MSDPTPQDAQARYDAMWAELAQTTTGLRGKPAFPAPHWANAHAIGVALRDEIGQLLPPVAPPPPPPPPPPQPDTPFAFDAKAMPRDPNSASRVTKFVSYADFSTAYMNANCAIYYAQPSDPLYPFSIGNIDAHVPIKRGTKPGGSTDHDLAIIDVGRGRQHGLVRSAYDAGTDRWTAIGGSSCAIDAIQEAMSGKSMDSTSASRIPISVGAVTPAQIGTGHINHTLRFRMAEGAVGPPPCPYPANTAYGGQGAAGNATFGVILAFPATLDEHSLGLPRTETILVQGIRDHGMVLTDGGWKFSIDAIDPVNQGGPKDWLDAGVTMTSSGGLFSMVLSPKIPWHLLEWLKPPVRA